MSMCSAHRLQIRFATEFEPVPAVSIRRERRGKSQTHRRETGSARSTERDSWEEPLLSGVLKRLYRTRPTTA
jgi:hypothetical protein